MQLVSRRTAKGQNNWFPLVYKHRGLITLPYHEAPQVSPPEYLANPPGYNWPPLLVGTTVLVTASHKINFHDMLHVSLFSLGKHFAESYTSLSTYDASDVEVVKWLMFWSSQIQEELSLLQIHLSFSMYGSSGDDQPKRLRQNVMDVFLQSVGIVLTDIQDVIFK